MPIQFNCPKCAQRLTLTASQPGDWLDCPSCDAPIMVPGAAPPRPAPARTVAATARPGAPPAREPFDFSDDPDADDSGAGGGWAGRRTPLGIAAVGLALLACAGLVLALALQKPKAGSEQARSDPPATEPEPAPPVPKTTQPPAPPKPKETPPDPPEPRPPEPDRPLFVEVPLTQVKQRTLRLGVSSKAFDDVGAILTALGKGYAFKTLTADDLESEARLSEFDVVFLNCGGGGERPERVAEALRQFVYQGRALYASDLQYPLVARAFPDAVDAKAQSAGQAGAYTAEVLDEGLREVLGREVELAFNLSGWQAAAFGGNGVVPVLRAAGNSGLKKGTPLLVKFSHGQGKVIFTSFHNSAIASDTAKKLLRYLVFSAVLADAESRVSKVLCEEKAFAVKASDVLTADGDGWTTSKKYALKKGGVFRVALAFNSEGAELVLSIEGPGGVKFEKRGKDAFIIQAQGLPAGEWALTVTAGKVPYPNFPLRLIVAEPNEP